jgi:hypothetical protein
MVGWKLRIASIIEWRDIHVPGEHGNLGIARPGLHPPVAVPGNRVGWKLYVFGSLSLTRDGGPKEHGGMENYERLKAHTANVAISNETWWDGNYFGRNFEKANFEDSKNSK